MPTPPLVVRIILEIVVLMSVIRLAWIFIDRYVRNLTSMDERRMLCCG